MSVCLLNILANLSSQLIMKELTSYPSYVVQFFVIYRWIKYAELDRLVDCLWLYLYLLYHLFCPPIWVFHMQVWKNLMKNTHASTHVYFKYDLRAANEGSYGCLGLCAVLLRIILMWTISLLKLLFRFELNVHGCMFYQSNRQLCIPVILPQEIDLQ